jgi:hypothetical protein
MAKPDTIHPLKDKRWGWVPFRPHEQVVFEDLSLQLPYEASAAGMTLTFEAPPEAPDPVYLKDKGGQVLREWRHTPSLTEVWEACRQILST